MARMSLRIDHWPQWGRREETQSRGAGLGTGGISKDPGGRDDLSERSSRAGEKRADKEASRIKCFRQMGMKRDVARVAPGFLSRW